MIKEYLFLLLLLLVGGLGIFIISSFWLSTFSLWHCRQKIIIYLFIYFTPSERAKEKLEKIWKIKRRISLHAFSQQPLKGPSCGRVLRTAHALIYAFSNVSKYSMPNWVWWTFVKSILGYVQNHIKVYIFSKFDFWNCVQSKYSFILYILLGNSLYMWKILNSL